MQRMKWVPKTTTPTEQKDQKKNDQVHPPASPFPSQPKPRRQHHSAELKRANLLCQNI